MRTLTVTGQGRATTVPDTALIRLSAVHRARGFAEAMAGAESARTEVVKAAGDLVVSTVNLSVWPTNEQGQQPGFEARHTLTIATGDLEVANELLTRLAYEVGSRLLVEGVELTVKDPGPAVGRAREAAFADARAKAEQFATLSGRPLGPVESVAEITRTNQDQLYRAEFAAGVADSSTPINPGEVTTSVSITVRYSLG